MEMLLPSRIFTGFLLASPHAPRYNKQVFSYQPSAFSIGGRLEGDSGDEQQALQEYDGWLLAVGLVHPGRFRS